MLLQPRQTPFSRLALALMVIAIPMLPARAQDPVIKPVPAPGTGDRLPQPRNVTAVQLPDGRIRVTWSPVPGATSYTLIRSVPPEPQRQITPNPTDTVFIDGDVTAGKTYYYLVSGASDAATGLRAGAPPVRATRSVGFSEVALTPTNVVARYDSAQNRVHVTWAGTSEVAHFVIYSSGAEVGRDYSLPGAFTMAAPAPGTRVQFQVRGFDRFGNASRLAASNELVIPLRPVAQSDSSSGGSTAASGPTSTTGPAGTVAVTIGSAITMRVGAAASAGSTLGGASATRWISLDDGIATVDGSGTVTARAPGRARLLAIATSVDGAVRVTLIQVTVTQ